MKPGLWATRATPNNSLKPWKTTRIPVKTSGTNGLRLTPREDRRGPSAGGRRFQGGLNRLPARRTLTKELPASAGQLCSRPLGGFYLRDHQPTVMLRSLGKYYDAWAPGRPRSDTSD